MAIINYGNFHHNNILIVYIHGPGHYNIILKDVCKFIS